jgi:2-keto-3-deoxy-L-rhamnonate aldolase RhmA
MKFSALKKFRAKLAADEPVYGLWITLESASLTDMAVALGLDWVVIDAEHGHLGWKEINEHVRAGLRSDTVVLVRLAERSTSLTKRVLDIGADGVVIPWVESVEDVENAILDCRYPPEGRRGIGGERATAWGQSIVEHTEHANEYVLVVLLIDRVDAAPNVGAMCAVDGVDVFLFGPADFSASAGFRGQWEGPGVADQILELKETIRAAGKQCGLITKSIEDLQQRRDQGFRMIGVGSDTGLFLRSLHESLKAVDRDRMPTTSLNPEEKEVGKA